MGRRTNAGSGQAREGGVAGRELREVEWVGGAQREVDGWVHSGRWMGGRTAGGGWLGAQWEVDGWAHSGNWMGGGAQRELDGWAHSDARDGRLGCDGHGLPVALLVLVLAEAVAEDGLPLAREPVARARAQPHHPVTDLDRVSFPHHFARTHGEVTIPVAARSALEAHVGAGRGGLALLITHGLALFDRFALALLRFGTAGGRNGALDERGGRQRRQQRSDERPYAKAERCAAGAGLARNEVPSSGGCEADEDEADVLEQRQLHGL